MRKLSTFTAAVLLAVLAGSMTACTGSGDTSPKEPGAKVTAKTEKGRHQDEESGAGQEEDDDTLTLALTGTAKWRNKVTATLSGFTRGATGEYALPENTAYLAFQVTVTNGTSKPLDLSMWTLSCPDGADEVFDTERGLNGAPDHHVLPGKTGAWKTACAFKRTQTKAQIEITPYDEGDELYRTAIFTGEVK